MFNRRFELLNLLCGLILFGLSFFISELNFFFVGLGVLTSAINIRVYSLFTESITSGEGSFFSVLLLGLKLAVLFLILISLFKAATLIPLISWLLGVFSFLPASLLALTIYKE